MMRRRQRRGDGVSPMLLMLAMRIYQQWEALPVKPPVTFGLVGLLVASHVAPHLALPFEIEEVCVSSTRVVAAFGRGDYAEAWRRLAFSSLCHADDVHLYFNVASLLVKGAMLETRMGSEMLLCFVVYAALASSLIYVAAAPLFAVRSCAVGFSAVLFAMKLVLNYDDFRPGSTRRASVFGVSIAARHAHWLEIIVASYVNPRSSLLGHAAGALAGLLWTQRPSIPWPRPPRYTYAAGAPRDPRVVDIDCGAPRDDLRRRRLERFGGDGVGVRHRPSVRI